MNPLQETAGDFSILLLNNAPACGICFGDSGSPNFIGDSNVVAGVTSFGLNGNCDGTGGVYHADRADDLKGKLPGTKTNHCTQSPPADEPPGGVFLAGIFRTPGLCPPGFLVLCFPSCTCPLPGMFSKGGELRSDLLKTVLYFEGSDQFLRRKYYA